MKVKEITLGSIVSICVLAGMAFGAVQYFQPREVAVAEHAEISEYSEVSKYENELKLINLEVTYLLNLPQRSAQDDNRLQYLNSRRLIVEQRLLELTGA